jgi:hypothetical protein
MKKPAIIVDLDGTLADIRVRLNHLHQTPKDWDSFHATLETDELHPWCREIVNRMAKDHLIIIISGRVESLRTQTENWLQEFNIKWDHLFMRPQGDHRPDYLLKKEIFDNFISDEFTILFVLEDRTQVVQMWRGLGLTCLQCASGNF